ncbi:glycoside hydrolase [Burkholderia ubonensis]|uniref:glycoside hydrolase family 24 protein n=1 Tax=Burkholderia ubonensis TaxID=101571 RepID=UPI00075AB7A1|nr:glycoside hydrolase family 104 protein [Burkholderia ubonensis]KVG89128.1 glycoside hydrolase [Burkholderia ubonensis]
MARISAQQAGGQNRVAFLDMIAASEIGSALLAKSNDGYNVLVGSTPARPMLFSSYVAHPNIYNTVLNSTAAGRYQLLFRWWVPYQKQLKLPDFGPLSQDMVALQQIRERNALSLIDAGQISAAIAACSNIWASLPGNGYGQHMNELSFLTRAYQAAGGVVTV